MKHIILAACGFFISPLFAAESLLNDQISDPSSVQVATFDMRANLPEEGQEVYRLWDSGKKRKAIRLAEKWIKKDKKNSGPWAVAAGLYCEAKKFRKCKKYAKKSLKRDPHNAIAFYWRGRAYEGKGKTLEAANEYRAAILAQEGFTQAEVALSRTTATLAQRLD